MHIESVPIERINPAAYNPRIDLQPGDRDYDLLQRSMDEFGFVEPLVWNRRTGNLVGGHQRLKILAARGVNRIEVSVVDLPPEREQALNVALNKIGGDWDERKLADLLTGLAQIPDFDVSLTGFDATEMTQLLDRLEALGDEDDFDLADALEAAQDQPPITAPGELIKLGRHRLLCGDTARSEDVERLLDGAKADLVFTDSPPDCYLPRLTLRFADGELSGGGTLSTPRVKSVLLHCLQPTSSKCVSRTGVGPEEILTDAPRQARGYRVAPGRGCSAVYLPYLS